VFVSWFNAVDLPGLGEHARHAPVRKVAHTERSDLGRVQPSVVAASFWPSNGGLLLHQTMVQGIGRNCAMVRVCKKVSVQFNFGMEFHSESRKFDSFDRCNFVLLGEKFRVPFVVDMNDLVFLQVI